MFKFFINIKYLVLTLVANKEGFTQFIGMAIINKLFLLFIFLLSTGVLASEYESGSFKVSKLRFGSGTVHVAVSPAPLGCEGGTHYRMHFKLNNSDPIIYKDMVAGLLSAHATGQKIQYLWYRNKGVCNNSHVLTLDMFEFVGK